MNFEYSDEIRQDNDLGRKVKIRHLEKLTPKLENAVEKMDDFYRLGQLLQGNNPQEAGKIIDKYLDRSEYSNGVALRDAVIKKFEEFQKEQTKLFEREEIDAFLREVTDGRYPSYFTLNHQGSAEPQSEINGGVYVCTFKNIFWNGEGKLYVFGNKNEEFKKYLRQVREAAEEKEAKGFFNGLPLEINKEQIKDYIKSNPDAVITGGEHKNPAEAMKKYGTDFTIYPSSPLGLTRINGTVKKQDLGEMVIACFMSGIQKSEDEKKNGESGSSFKGTYNGRDNIEAVSVLYSGLPYSGLGDWGGRIEVSPNEIAPEVYKDFKSAGYRFGDLAELMINLQKRKITFFNVNGSKQK